MQMKGTNYVIMSFYRVLLLAGWQSPIVAMFVIVKTQKTHLGNYLWRICLSSACVYTIANNTYNNWLLY